MENININVESQDISLNLGMGKIEPVTQEKEVNPTTEIQEVIPDEGFTGLSKVTVNAIIGDTLEITPSKEEQTFNGVYTEVKSKGVTSEVDENITPNNIKIGVSILGVDGTLEAVDYWSTEPSININLKNYIKEAPRNIDVSNKTSLNGFFSSSTSLENADLNNWNTENCTDFSNMFNSCKKLKSVKANNLNTSKITTISNMFQNCQELKRIDLKNWNTPNLTKMDTAFNGCSSLEYLDIRNFTFDNVILSGWEIFSNVPNNCLIIVKGDTEKAWVKARKSSFTNIKTVAEL